VATIRVNTVAGKTYTLQYRDSLTSGSWLKVADATGVAGDGVVTVSDPAAPAKGSRYYRVVTPSQP
jgi:hypothetical protein